MKAFKCNILLLFFSWNKSERKQDKKKQQKTRKVKIKTRQQGRTKNKKEEGERKRERERESVTKRSERSQGERKGGTEKWTKITLFQGEKQCFCKKTPKNKKIIRRVEGQLPKNTRAMRRYPHSQEECEQKRKHPKKKRGMWRGPL